MEDYKAISNYIGDVEQLKRMPGFLVKKFNDAIFMGQINEAGERQGLGVMVYKYGRIYEGAWGEDKRHGKGYEVYSNGNIYEGEF